MQGLPFSVEEIRLVDLLAGSQPYAFSLYLKKLGLWDEKWPESSLESCGILSPVLAKRSGKNPQNVHVLDGFKRVYWASSRGMASISCVFVPGSISEYEAWMIVFAAQKHVLCSSALKAAFLQHLEKSGVSRETIINKFMPALELGPSEHLLKKYLKIAGLPEKVLSFCHSKGFSAKRCLNLSHHKKGLLESFFSRSHSLSLSARLAEELLNDINDILRREGISPEEFFCEPEIAKIFQDRTDNRIRTERLRDAVRKRKFPVLTSIERQMEKAKQRLLDERSFRVSWDRTLENRAINLSASVKSPREFMQLVRELEQEDTLEGIRILLSFL